jgi:hypothetical protein
MSSVRRKNDKSVSRSILVERKTHAVVSSLAASVAK